MRVFLGLAFAVAVAGCRPAEPQPIDQATRDRIDRLESELAALKRELATAKKNEPLPDTPGGVRPPADDPPKSIADRVQALEKLILVHDNVLRQTQSKPPGP